MRATSSASTLGKPATFADRVRAATAPGRDRFIDAVRAGSLLVVVLGHWLMATVVVQDGHLTGANALTAIPALQPSTWLLQVMPLFFVAGGFSNITVWRSLRRRGDSYPEYLHGRLVRLLRPTLVFVLFWHLAGLTRGTLWGTTVGHSPCWQP